MSLLLAAAQSTDFTQIISTVLGVGIAAIVVLGVVRFFKKPIVAESTAAKPRVPWDWLDALSIGTFLFLVPQVFVGVLLARGDTAEGSVSQNFLAVLLIEVITITLLFVFLKRRGVGLRALGFRRLEKSDFLYVLSGYFVYFVLLLMTLAAIGHLVPGFNGDQVQSTGFENSAGKDLAITFIALVVFPPLAEEMLFRGFVYTGLKTRFTKVVSALIVSGSFALAHGQWNVAVDTFILSLVMIYIFERTKNLWVTIGLHSLKNGIAFMALYFYK